MPIWIWFNGRPFLITKYAMTIDTLLFTYNIINLWNFVLFQNYFKVVLNYQELFIFECILAVCSASQFENRNNHIEYYWALLYYKNSGKYPIFWAISIKPIDSLPPILFFFVPKIHDTLSCSSVWTEKEKKAILTPFIESFVFLKWIDLERG